MAGNVPEWGALAVALRSMIASERVSRGADFAVMLEEAAGLSPDDLLRAVEQSHEHAELLATAWDAASRAPDERKRRLLARAAAQGLTADGAEIDDVPLFVRTLDDLDSSERSAPLPGRVLTRA